MSSSPKEIVERILRNDQVHPIEVEQQDLKQVGSSKKVGQSQATFCLFFILFTQQIQHKYDYK